MRFLKDPYTRAGLLGAVLAAFLLAGGQRVRSATNPGVTLPTGKTTVTCSGPLSAARTNQTTFVLTCKAPTPAPQPAPITGYPGHTGIVATSFWVGELFNANLSDGSQACSTYDAQWDLHFSGVATNPLPPTAAGCAGSYAGGCDGQWRSGTCSTETRSSTNGYFPLHMTPLENPFYLDLPFDDLNDPTAFAERCTVIPWAKTVDPSGAHCADHAFSYMKNQWVALTGPNGKTCYGQVEDAGPSHGSLYHDAAYVFGTADARPVQGQFNDAGMDVSPALNGCLGFAELDGDSDRISWAFIDAGAVPAGPWKQLVTTSGVQTRP